MIGNTNRAQVKPIQDIMSMGQSSEQTNTSDPLALFDQIRQRYEHTRPQGPQRGWGDYAERSA